MIRVVVLVLIGIALMAFLGASTVRGAERTCVTDYRQLSAHEGWRRWRLVDGQRCWHTGSRRSAARRAGPVVRPPVVQEAPVTLSLRFFDVYVRSYVDRVRDGFMELPSGWARVLAGGWQ